MMRIQPACLCVRVRMVNKQSGRLTSRRRPRRRRRRRRRRHRRYCM